MEGHYERLKNLDDEEVNTFHEITRHDPLYKYPGRIYAVYDIRKGSNKVYIGSTFQGWEARLRHHYQTAVGNRFGDSRFYRWLRQRLEGTSSFEEAKEFIKLSVIKKVGGMWCYTCEKRLRR